MSAFALKCIALLAMAIDHTGAVFFPDQAWLRYIGRLAFPIFAFLLTEGFLHTSSKRNYFLRLGAFALLSEVPYDLCLFRAPFDPEHQNILFELCAGFLLLWCLEKALREGKRWFFLPVPLLFLGASYFSLSYGIYGLAMIAVFYLFSGIPHIRALSGAVVTYGFNGFLSLGFPFLGRTIHLLSSNFTQLYAVAASVPLLFYNGKKGRYSLKWFFYLFYPAHLLLLWAVSLAVL